MQSQAKVVLVGAGRMGQVRAPLLYAHARANLVAVVDPYVPAGAALAGTFGALHFVSLADAVEATRPDCVWIATGTSTHEELILRAAAKGLHIFCEKPVHGEPGKIEELFAACAKAGVKLCCGFQRRFDPSYRAARQHVLDGRVGTPTMVRVFFADHPIPPLEFLKKEGDPFMDLAPHDIDFVNWVLRDHPVQVFGSGSSSTRELADCGVLDNSMITLVYSKGTLVTLMMSRGAQYGYDQRAEIFGTKGMVQVENQRGNECVLSTAAGVQGAKLMHSFPERFREAFSNEVDAFIRAVLCGDAWPVRSADCVKTQKICIAASESQRLGAAVAYESCRLQVRPVGNGSFGAYATGLFAQGRRATILEPYSRSGPLSWADSVVGDPSVHAVYIASPDELHQPQAIECLEAGKHVLVEKPVKPAFEQVRRVWDDACSSHPGLVFMVGFQRRYHDQFLAAKEFVRRTQGIKKLVVTSRDPVPAVEDLVHVLYNSVCHDVDMMCWLFPGLAFSATSVRLDAATSGIEIDGCLALASSVAAAGEPVQVRLLYAKGADSYVQEVRVEYEAEGRKEARFGTAEFSACEDGNFCSVYRHAYEAQFSHFVDLCENGEPASEAAERMDSYSRTFRVLNELAARQEFAPLPA